MIVTEVPGTPEVGDKLLIVGAIPVPLSVTVCGLLPALSVSTNEPLIAPPEVGRNPIDNRQDWPVASVPAAEEPELTSVHEDAPLVSRVKFAEILGLFPLPGIGKLSTALPTFSTVTVCGLSLLVAPGTVNAKVRLGGSERSSFNTRLLPVSEI